MNKILEALKAALPKASKKQIELLATYYEKTTESEEQAIEAAKTASEELLSMLTAFGDFRATQAAEKVRKDLNIEKPIEKEEEPQPEKPQPKSPSPELEAIKKQLAEMQAAINATQRESIAEKRAASVKELIKDLPDYLAKPYARLNLSDLSEEEFSELAAEAKAGADAYQQAEKARGSVFTTPKGGTTLAADKATIEEVNAMVNTLNL